MVELSDQANGRVVADAVADHVTYTPTLTTSGTVDIYAKWSENSTRATAVKYRIQHAGGATDILVNQQQPSSGWFRLGAFAMALGQDHRMGERGLKRVGIGQSDLPFVIFMTTNPKPSHCVVFKYS